MKCEECEEHQVEVMGTTDDARTGIRCKACGFQWLHGPSPEDQRLGTCDFLLQRFAK